MLWLGVALWGMVMLGLVRRPGALGVGMLLPLLLLSTGLVFLGGLERALPPLFLLSLSLGVFLPPSRPPRAPRVAARRHKGAQTVLQARAFRSKFVPNAQDTSSPLDLWDIPGYEVLEKVGSGGMASVFRARRKRDGKIVALKIPAEHFVFDEKFVRRFHREAEVVQRLVHPNIVQTFEHGCVGNKHFMVMEFVAGHSLELYLDDPEKRRDYAASCELMRQVVVALRYIHEAGVVHRDIKPANLMLRDNARNGGHFAPDALKLMDFGIAGGQVNTRLTMMGTRIGTPTYMSPEQARGLRTDERSDIYSLGLVFYELLTGQSAFRGGYEVILHQQIFQTPPTPRQLEPHIPAVLDRLVMQMIQKEAEARPSLAEIAYRLTEDLDTPEVEPRSRLLCAIEAETGAALRILDTDGNLNLALGDVGKALPAAPQACACDRSGNLYVAVLEEDAAGASYPLIHKLSKAGEVLLSFGHFGVQPGEFLRPVALALAPDDSLWVLDAETHRAEHFSAQGAYLGGFGGPGEGAGRFNDPRDLLVNVEGELFVLDYGNRQVQHFAPDGAYLNRWAFRAKRAEGELTPEAIGIAALRPLSGIALSTTGELYLNEALSGKVHRIGPRGKPLDTFALHRLEGEVQKPDTLVDLGVDESGNLFTAERGGSAIRKYGPSGELLATLETYAPILQLRVDVKAQRQLEV